MKRFVLASSSPRRKALLQKIGMEFCVIPANVDESLPKDIAPVEAVKQLSYRKALNTSLSVDFDSIIIAADTVVYFDKILGKPIDSNDAYNMLKMLQGNEHKVYTGLCLFDVHTGKYKVDSEETRVHMVELNDHDIRSYIDSGECFDKAGAYAIQGKGGMFIDKIYGCYYNVVGLPIALLRKMLLDFDIRL